MNALLPPQEAFTPWFGPDERPIRNGRYAVKVRQGDQDEITWGVWINVVGWHSPSGGILQIRAWRGLTTEAMRTFDLVSATIPKGSERTLFRPGRMPHRGVFDALAAEMQKRMSKTLDEWIAGERQTVHLAACALFPAYGVRRPTMDEVKRAETYAKGSVDYACTWVSQLYRMCEEVRA